jgi:LytS/YehU family sensor histidine kinase
MSQLDSLAEIIFARKRWLLHVIFWLVVLIFYAILFGRQNSNYWQTFFFIGLLMPMTIGTSYFLGYYLVPKFLLKERYGHFLLYFTYTIVGSLMLEMMVVFATFILIAKLQIKNMSPASFDLFFLLTALLMVVFLSVAIRLLMHWRKSRTDYDKLMREKTEAELRFLKNQLNPHFLFNTLNNLYYLATEKSDQAPKAILSLSEILDYVLNASKQVFVPLEHEWKQAENYIALELLRYQDRVSIEKTLAGKVDGSSICPMLLLTLLENAFKHGVMPATGKSWIRLNLDTSVESIKIQISNSVADKISETKGIGLQNLKSQLQHLYGNNYELNIQSNEKEFNLTLQLTAYGKN